MTNRKSSSLILPSIKSIERLKNLPEPVPQNFKKRNDFTTKALRLRNEPFQRSQEPIPILYWESQIDHLASFPKLGRKY